MEKRTVYYATFYMPGAFVAEQWSNDLDSPDPHKVKWPKNAYCFTMHKRVDVVDGTETYQGKPEKVGKTYYHPKSKVQTLEQARKHKHSTPTLLSNMEINKWSHIVWTRWGNWPQPFDPAEDEVLTDDTEV